MTASPALSRIGLAGLGVMGQNLALNIGDKGFPISVYNPTASKVDETPDRAAKEGRLPLSGHYSPRDFVLSLRRPRSVIILVKDTAPVDHSMAALSAYLEPGDTIIGGNDSCQNTEQRIRETADKGLLYLGMGISGGEEGARFGPSLMPGGSLKAYQNVEDILNKAAAQERDGPCVTYIREGGSGNFVKLVHNLIAYCDMQLISDAYNILKNVGGCSKEELAEIFGEWNNGELESFLIGITANILKVEDDLGGGFLVEKILDKTGVKGTGEWSAQSSFSSGVLNLRAAPTISASLSYTGSSKEALPEDHPLKALKRYPYQKQKVPKRSGKKDGGPSGGIDKRGLVDDVRRALYASKICSYDQAMNLLRAKSVEKGWNLNMGEVARIWKGGCMIRGASLESLLVDPETAREMAQRLEAWRRVVDLEYSAEISMPAMSSSLAYFDEWRSDPLRALCMILHVPFRSND